MQDTLLDKMPDSMRKDVEKLLQDIPAARKRPERFTRKEQAKQAVSGPPVALAVTADGPSTTAAAPQEEEVMAALSHGICRTAGSMQGGMTMILAM